MFNKSVLCRFSCIKNDFILFCNLKSLDESSDNSFKKGQYRLTFNLEPTTSINIKKAFTQSHVFGLFCFAEEKADNKFDNLLYIVENIEFDDKELRENSILLSFEKQHKITTKDFKTVEFSEIEQFRQALQNKTMAKVVNI